MAANAEPINPINQSMPRNLQRNHVNRKSHNNGSSMSSRSLTASRRIQHNDGHGINLQCIEQAMEHGPSAGRAVENTGRKNVANLFESKATAICLFRRLSVLSRSSWRFQPLFLDVTLERKSTNVKLGENAAKKPFLFSTTRRKRKKKLTETLSSFSSHSDAVISFPLQQTDTACQQIRLAPMHI